MNSSQRPFSEDEIVELESLVGSDDFDPDTHSGPDAPLTMPSSPPSSSSQPKWLTQYAARRPIWISWAQRAGSLALTLLRPRLTWRYVLFALLVLYTAYCFLINSPLLASPLPDYTGPHGVGAVDLEVPLPDGPRRVHDAVFKDSGKPAFEVETVLLTLYYPTDSGFRSSKPRYHWIPKPVGLTAGGYAKLAHIDSFITTPLFTFIMWALAGRITIPAEVDAPLLGTTSDKRDDDRREKQDPFPVMVFSHGMASSRTDYTHFLGELASRGHVIAAIEHRDGSSPGSYVKPSSADPATTNRLHFRKMELEEDMDDAEFKRAQLAFRDAEILAAIDVVTAINNGKGGKIPVDNTRDEASTLPSWSSRLNLSLLTIGGHSYGATGALQALSTVAPGDKAAAGLILDPGKSSGPLNHNATVPLLVIHSNSWSKKKSMFHGRPHFDTVRDLVKACPAPSWFLTSIGTSHPSVTDAPLLEPLMLSWTTGADMDVKGALREYVNSAGEFLQFVQSGLTVPDGLLSENVTHEEYGKWVSEERKKEFSSEMTDHWEIHVSPDI